MWVDSCGWTRVGGLVWVDSCARGVITVRSGVSGRTPTGVYGIYWPTGVNGIYWPTGVNGICWPPGVNGVCWGTERTNHSLRVIECGFTHKPHVAGPLTVSLQADVGL